MRLVDCSISFSTMILRRLSSANNCGYYIQRFFVSHPTFGNNFGHLSTRKLVQVRRVEGGLCTYSLSKQAINENGTVAKSDTYSTSDVASGEDWFADRYTNRSFHVGDGLEPGQWLLIYRIPDEKQRDRVEYGLYGIAVWSLACGCLIFGLQCSSRSENPFTVAPALWLVGMMAIMYATRLRRYGAVRLYTRKRDQEEWERWRHSQMALPAQLRDVYAPTRHYCIIWKDMFHRSRSFVYNSRQISDAVHRKTWLDRSMNGSFLVKGRPWALHPDYFDEPPDYIFARRLM